jgi:hypothetical protein
VSSCELLCGPLIKQESGQTEFSTWPVAKGAFNIRHKVDEAAGSTPPTAAVNKEAVDRVVEAVRLSTTSLLALLQRKSRGALEGGGG